MLSQSLIWRKKHGVDKILSEYELPIVAKEYFPGENRDYYLLYWNFLLNLHAFQYEILAYHYLLDLIRCVVQTRQWGPAFVYPSIRSNGCQGNHQIGKDSQNRQDNMGNRNQNLWRNSYSVLYWILYAIAYLRLERKGWQNWLFTYAKKDFVWQKRRLIDWTSECY